MSGVIDKNVVQMVFDNTLFQKNAQDTLSTLDKLKEALNFEGVAKGLEGLGNNVKNVGMDGLYDGVYKVRDGFSALDVVATRVLQNITDKVQGIATDLVKKVTLEPLKAGLEEYETQINSVQTILANTNDALIENGLTTEHDRIEKINGVLDDLNQYADMTIYNFTEMTRNIGTFTAAGVELDTAATSIKGIANLAAMSGSNSQQASTAMYQLSQAIAAGSVKLQDWNSVVNAGMGGKLFQNELIDTAKAMGVADEQFIALTNGATTFRESLSSGWISAEVLTNTLEKFTAGSEGYTKSQVEQMKQLWRARGYSEQQIEELTRSIKTLDETQEKNLRTKWAEKGFNDEQIDHILSMGTAATEAATKVKTFSQLLETVGEALQSGWTQSWEYIIGDFEQAKMLWTEISDIMNLYIGKSADARNNVLKEWSRAAYSYNENGELIKLTYDEAGNLIEDADNQIVKDGKMIREEMGGRELVIQSMRNTFQGMFEVAMEFSKAWDLGFWGKGTQNDISITAQKLKDMSLALYDFSTNFKNTFQRDETGKAVGLLGELRESFDKFAQTMRNAYFGVKDVFSGLGNILSSFFNSNFFSIESLNVLLDTFGKVVNVFSEFANVFKREIGPSEENRQSLISFFNGLQKALEQFFTIKVDFITNLFEGLGLIFEHIIGPGRTVATILGDFGSKLLLVSNAIGNIFKNSDGSSKFTDMFTDVARGVNDFIDALKANADFSSFTDMFSKITNILSDNNTKVFDTFKNVIESIFNIIKPIMGVLTPLFVEVSNFVVGILPKAIDFLYQLSERIKSFTESLIPSSDTISGLQTLFKGIFDILSAIGQVIGTVFLSAWDSLGQILRNLLPDGKEFGDILTTIGTKLTEFADKIKGLVDGGDGVPKLSELMGSVTDKFIKFMDTFKNLNLLEAFIGLIKRIGDGIKHALGGTEDMTLFDTIIEKIKGFLDGIKRILSDENGQLDLVKVFEAGGIGVLIKKLVEMLMNLKQNAGNLTGVLSFINDIKEALTGLSEAFQEKFKAESIKAIATSILEIAGALFIIAMIDPVALATAIGAVKAMFVMIAELLAATKGFDKTDVAALGATAALLQTLGNSILMMAGAVFVLGSMPLENTIQGVVALCIMLEGLVLVVKKLSSIEKDLPKVAGTLIALAFAIDLLTIPVAVLGRMDLANLAKGLGAVAAMMYILVTAVTTLSDTTKNADLLAVGFGLIEISAAMRILAEAIKVMGGMELGELAKGLVTFGVALGGLVYASKVVSSGGKGGTSLADDMLALGGAMLMLGFAMTEFAVAGKLMHAVEWEDLGKMAAVFVAALIGLGVASHLINGANLLMIAGAIALVATAFLELNVALGLAQLVGPLMTAISAAIQGFSHSLESFAHSAARDAFLQFLKDAILFLPQLAVALAQALVEMVVALGAGAAKIIGAVVNIGKEILQGLVTLLPELFNVVRTFIEQVVQLAIDETPRIFEALTVFFEQLWVFLAEQVPNFFTFLTTVFTELFTFLQTEAPLLIETIRIMIDTVLQAIIAEAPVVGETLLTLLHTILDIINTAIPEITFTLLNLLTTILQQLATFVPQMAQAAMEIILGFLTAIAENIGAITEAAISIALGFMQGITEKMPEIVDTAFKMIIGFIDGLASAIEANHQALFDAIAHLISAIVGALVDGITQLAGAVRDWFTSPGGILESIGGFFQDLFNAGANLVQGFIDGLLSMPRQLWDAACSLAQDAWAAITGTLDEHSPSRLTYGGGKNFTLGFINGISDFSKNAAGTSAEMARGVLVAFNDAINKDANSYSPAISPVIDTSYIQNGMQDLNDFMYSIPDTYDITANIDQDNALKRQLIDIMGERNDYSEILAGMHSLKEEIGQLGVQMSRMQIIMDSGALVGELTPDIDIAMGQRQMLASRGVF